jgi:hypothetical protein
MVLTKILTLEDLPDIIVLLKKKKRISHTFVDEWNWNHWTDQLQFLLTDDNTRIIGCFDDNKLKAFVIQQILEKLPMWCMILVAQDNDNKWLKKGHGDYLNLCLLVATEYAETKGIFEVLYTVPTKWLKTTRHTQPTSPVWSKYDIYIEDIIPAGTLPKYAIHQLLCGPVPRSHDRAIKKCCLKAEYRLKFLNKYSYD